MSPANPPSIEELRQLPKQRAEEIHTNKNLDAIDDFFAPDWIGHTNGEDLTRAEYKAFERQFNTGFPDAELTYAPVIVEGDTLAAHWVMTGTHAGEVLGVDPTGRTVTVTGTFIARYDEEGRAVESWQTVDQLGMLRQLDLAPEDLESVTNP